MTTPRVSLCYIDPDWNIEVTKPTAKTGRQFVIEIDRVEIIIKEDLFPRFLLDLREHFEGAIREYERFLADAHKERMAHVPEARS